MRLLLSIILLACVQSFGASYFVRTNGNDTTGDGSTGNAWRTVAKALTIVGANDTVTVGNGEFDESLASSDPGLLLQAENLWGPQIKHFRSQATNQTVKGFRLTRFSDATRPWGQSLNASLRVEVSSHNFSSISNWFGPTVHVVSTNFTFVPGSPTNAIVSPLVDFNAAGFTNSSHIYIGSSGLTNLYPAVHNTAWMVHSVSADGHTLYVTNDTASSFPADSGTNYWAAIHAGNGSESLYSIYGAQSGGAYATNWTVIGNVFTNTFGAPIFAFVDGAVIRSNYFGMHWGYRTIALQGKNIYFENNTVKGLRSAARYTQQEIQNLVHPGGADWFDYASSEFSAFSGNSSNIFIRWNWIQDVDNQLGLADPFTNSYGLYVHSNVFVGVTEHWSGGRSGNEFVGNTFYRTATEFGESYSLTVGSAGNPVTDMKITQNVFIDIGDHSGGTNFGNTEGWYTISTNAISPVLGSNWVAGAEKLGWQAKTTFAETNGVNGGDPAFVDADDPMGPDGLPFTNDDGLRPVPGSRLALLGWGALSPPTNGLPVAHFSLTSPIGWLDDNTTNYSPSWVALKPWDRAVLGSERPWQTPDAVGRVPATISLALSNTFDGTSIGMTNIYRWSIDWGDGAVTPAATFMNPWTASHTYTTAGTNTVTLYVTNYAGQSDSFTMAYRVLPNDGSFTNRLFFVDSLSGNDSNSGTGTWANAWASLTKVGTNTALLPGDIISARGTFTPWMNITRTGSITAPIQWLGFGATNGGWRVRQPDHRFYNWTMNMTNVPAFDGAFHVYPEAHRLWVVDSTITDMIDPLDPGAVDRPAVLHFRTTGVQEVGQSASSCLYSNLLVTGCNDLGFSLYGSSNRVCYNRFFDNDGQADFVRPFGVSHDVHNNEIYNLSLVKESHTDFVQLFGYDQGTNASPDTNAYITVRDIRVYNNWLSNCVAQLGQFEVFNNPSNMMSNLVFFGNSFIKLKDKGSLGMNGIKLLNNGWYSGPYSNGNVFVGGSTKGSAYGSWATNNVFWNSGTTVTNNRQGWYGAELAFMETNGNFFADYNYVYPTKRTDRPSFPTSDSERWGSWLNAHETNGINGTVVTFVSTNDGRFIPLTNDVIATSGFNAYAFVTNYGIPSVDLFGRPRASSGAWAMGPVESGASFSTNSGGGGGGSTNDPTGRSWISRQLIIRNLIVNQ